VWQVLHDQSRKMQHPRVSGRDGSVSGKEGADAEDRWSLRVPGLLLCPFTSDADGWTLADTHFAGVAENRHKRRASPQIHSRVAPTHCQGREKTGADDVRNCGVPLIAWYLLSSECAFEFESESDRRPHW